MLSPGDQKKIVFIALIQIFLAGLDLVSIALIGLIASITLFGIQSRDLPVGLERIIEIVGLGPLDFQTQVAILGLATGILLVTKTLFSAYISRRILFFLNRKTALVTALLLKRVLSQPYDYIKTRSSTEVLFSLTRGVNALIAGVLGSASQILTEVSLLVVVFVGLVVFDPLITMFCLLYFGLISFLQTKRLKRMAEQSQSDSTKALVRSESHILESLSLYRELHVRYARSPQIESLIKTRTEMAEFYSRVMFMPYVTKYTMEVALVFGAILLMASQFLVKDALSAISTLSVFLVAATRVTPSLLRLQVSLIKFKSSVGESGKTLNLMGELENSNCNFDTELSGDLAVCGEIKVDNLYFQYRDGKDYVVRDVNLHIFPGEMIALVGPSGNGKSTILDLLMGSLLPTLGSVTIDGLSPHQFVRKFPGKIGYVSQESVFTNSSIKANLLLGLEEDSCSTEQIWELLELVDLKKVVESMSDRLDSQIGERGLLLSSGQKQRLSIARAMITKPKLLFLDEPTSALDLDSEKLIIELIKTLQGNTTIVVIAHRLETIKNADKVVKIVDGRVDKIGTYSEIFEKASGASKLD